MNCSSQFCNPTARNLVLLLTGAVLFAVPGTSRAASACPPVAVSVQPDLLERQAELEGQREAILLAARQDAPITPTHLAESELAAPDVQRLLRTAPKVPGAADRAAAEAFASAARARASLPPRRTMAP